MVKNVGIGEVIDDDGKVEYFVSTTHAVRALIETEEQDFGGTDQK